MEEPVYPPADPTPPPHLTEGARRYWAHYFPLLQSQGVLTAADVGTLASYCAALADADTCHATIERDGWVVETPKGLIKHPLTSVLNQQRGQINTLSSQLGLNPSMRSRTRAAPKEVKKPKTDFDNLL